MRTHPILASFLLHVGVAAWLLIFHPWPEPTPMHLSVSLEGFAASHPIQKSLQIKAKPAAWAATQLAKQAVAAEDTESDPNGVKRGAVAAAAPLEPPLAAASPGTVIDQDKISRDRYIGDIMARFEQNKTYPIEAIRRAEQGIVKLAFSLDGRGHVLHSSVAQSSGFHRLDKAALDAVAKSDPLPPPPQINNKDAVLDFTLPITFALGAKE